MPRNLDDVIKELDNDEVVPTDLFVEESFDDDEEEELSDIDDIDDENDFNKRWYPE